LGRRSGWSKIGKRGKPSKILADVLTLADKQPVGQERPEMSLAVHLLPEVHVQRDERVLVQLAGAREREPPVSPKWEVAIPLPIRSTRTLVTPKLTAGGSRRYVTCWKVVPDRTSSQLLLSMPKLG
jgi:hypothetical protein